MVAIRRTTTAVVVVLAVLASIAVPAGTVHADGPRPPTSGNLGLVPANRATDVIPANIAIAPRAGETFPEFTIIAVQMAPMTKVLRDGTVDPHHAVAYWDFTLRFPRNTMSWPPFLPEPTDPWHFYFYEMPDGGLTGIGPRQGSPLYSPPTNLPADWLTRLVPAARAAIDPTVFSASIVPYLTSMVFGSVPVPASVNQAMLNFVVQADAIAAAGGTAGDLAAAANSVAEFIASQFTVQALGAALGLGGATLGLIATLSREPCYAKTAAILGEMLGVLGAIIGVSVAKTIGARALFIGIVLVLYADAIFSIRAQITTCAAYVEAANAAGQPEIAAILLDTSSVFIMLSMGALLIPVFVVGASIGLSALLNWWGEPALPAGLLAMFGLG